MTQVVPLRLSRGQPRLLLDQLLRRRRRRRPPLLLERNCRQGRRYRSATQVRVASSWAATPLEQRASPTDHADRIHQKRKLGQLVSSFWTKCAAAMARPSRETQRLSNSSSAFDAVLIGSSLRSICRASKDACKSRYCSETCSAYAFCERCLVLCLATTDFDPLFCVGVSKKQVCRYIRLWTCLCASYTLAMRVAEGWMCIVARMSEVLDFVSFCS